MRRARPFTLVLLLPSACGTREPGGGDDEPGLPDAAPDAYRPDSDPGCHWDCFGYTECSGGRVIEWAHVPVPCEYWTGECPNRVLHECAGGCVVDGARYDPSEYPTWRGIDDPTFFCAETPSRRAGDSCDDDFDCLPNRAVSQADGTVATIYLACDVAAGRCIETAPPAVSDWLTPCPASVAEYRGTGRAGYDYGACSQDLCLFSDDAAAGCVRSGCTLACRGDHECPAGSLCTDDVPSWAFDGGLAVCKPPPAGDPGAGLSCRPRD